MGLDAGARLGPYEIRGLLGAGGMGEVYRARDSRLARDVAIKVLPGAAAVDADRLERFQREARAAGALNHPNVLAVFDAGVEGGAPYVVSELLEGETLRDRLRTGGLPLQRAIQCGTQIARGLAAAHEKGIVHRDLKPENLFLTKDGRAKILDFGLAKLRETERPPGEAVSEELTASNTDAGVILGTVGYMSPEQARGLPADPRSDIFSFGAVLYEMLAQRRAFQGTSTADTLAAILKEDPPELARGERPVPPGLERIVRRCLEKDPEQRFRSAHDLAFALEALSGVALSTAVAPPAPRRGLWAALALLAVLGLPVAAFLGGLRTAEPKLPLFQRLTFRRGAVIHARYAPDGQTVVYAASWDGDPMLRLFSTRVESPESTRLDLPEAGLLGVSRTGELALALRHPFSPYAGLLTLARVPLAGGTPRAVLDDVAEADWSPDGSAFAVVRWVGNRARLEFPIGKTLFEDAAIWNPRVSPDGERVAFRHGPPGLMPGVESSLAVVDRAGNRTELLGGWNWARGLAWAPAGNEVWLTARRGGPMATELWAVSLSGKLRLVMRLPSWTVLQDIAPDGRVLLTHGLFRIGATCLPPGADRERDVSWFAASRVLDLSSDGRTLLFEEEGEGALYVANTTEKVAPIRLGEASFGAALSPDGRWAAVKTPKEIVLLPTGAGEPRKLSLAGVTPIFIRWSRDGKRCLLVGMEPGHIPRTYSLDVEDGRLQPLSAEGLACLSSSPDDRELLCGDLKGKWTVFSVERQQGRPAQGIQEGDNVLDWATDGAVYVRAATPGPTEIYRVDVQTGRRRLWRRIVMGDPAGLVGGAPELLFVAPQGEAYCYSTWWNLFDLYQVTGLK
ncbi:MAG TPA: protein kinase [Vicinamibacteria bacterium]|nr:protein kinase [Vicinamibacteria bacterium]